MESADFPPRSSFCTMAKRLRERLGVSGDWVPARGEDAIVSY